jgi:hypothetical protein
MYGLEASTNLKNRSNELKFIRLNTTISDAQHFSALRL